MSPNSPPKRSRLSVKIPGLEISRTSDYAFVTMGELYNDMSYFVISSRSYLRTMETERPSVNWYAYFMINIQPIKQLCDFQHSLLFSIQ